MGDGGGRGRGIEASWTRFARSGVEAANSGIKSSNFASKRGMIFGAIGPRSRPNHRRGRSSGHLDAILPLKECNRRSIAMRSWCDRGSIAPRSRRSSRSLLCLKGKIKPFKKKERLESDAPDVFQKKGKNPTSRGRWIAIARSEG